MKKNQKILIVFLLASFAIVWFFLSRDKEIVNYPVKGNIIVAFGDSLVEGVGATNGGDFVTLVGKNLGIEIKNLGRAGDTTSDGLSRINSVISLNPDITILLLGGNDAIRKVPIKTTESNLRAIISKLQMNGALVVLLGVRGGLLTDPYDSMYEKVANESGSVYIENILKGLFGDSKYMDDAIHPNDAGYAVIAERVIPVMRNILNRKL